MTHFDDITIDQFWEMLEQHDWHYPMANGAAYERGYQNAKKIKAIAAEKGLPFQFLLASYQNYINAGYAHGVKTNPAPKPIVLAGGAA